MSVKSEISIIAKFQTGINQLRSTRYLRRLRIELTPVFYSYMEWTKRLSHEIYFDVFSASSGVGGEHEQ
ncbi:MAG: hypothetical protein WCP55_14230 [Lentisphaerota bacterium]